MPGKILITGGHGYLGAGLAKRLAAAGYAIAILNRTPRGVYEEIQADITRPEEVEAAFDAARKIDFVLHLAAIDEVVAAQDPVLAFRVNALGTKHVCEAAKKRGARVVYFSTFHVYGRGEGMITEELTPHPRHPYPITKLAGEHYCAASGADHVIFRLANAVGAPEDETGRWKLLMLSLCKQAHEDRRLQLHGSGVHYRDLISFDDITAAIELARGLPQGVYNLGAGKAVRLLEAARIVQDQYEAIYGERIPIATGDGPVSVPELNFDIAKLRSHGFVPSTDLAKEARDILTHCERFR